MAEVLQEWPGNKKDGGRYARYIDGQVWRLSVKELGKTSVNTAQQGIRQAAERRGMTIRYLTIDDDTFIVQAIQRGVR